MSSPLLLRYKVSGDDFARAGEASSNIKNTLKQLGFPPSIIRRAVISLYEGEINMVIHAGGGEIRADIDPHTIKLELVDEGPGIADIEKSMEMGYSTASDEARSLGFGAGLGLPNMQKNSDKLIINSRLGQGTKVVMEIYNKGAQVKEVNTGAYSEHKAKGSASV